MISVKINRVNTVASNLRGKSERVRAAVGDAMEEQTLELRDAIYAALSGQILQPRTGRLRSALQILMTETEDSIKGTVYISGVPYAALLEQGGMTASHTIYPVNARALAFMSRGVGSVIFAKKVDHPGSKIPEFGYMRKTLAAMKDKIVASVRAAALGAAVSP